MSRFVAYGYSDDCADITGLDTRSEYDVPNGRGAPYRLVVDGVEIGTCVMKYDGAWRFEVELDDGHTMRAKATTPVVED